MGITHPSKNNSLNSRLKKNGLLSAVVVALVVICPFSKIINQFVFFNQSFFSISSFNFVLIIVVCIGVVSKLLLARIDVQAALFFSALFVLLFVVLLKILLQNGYTDLFSWLGKYQYYFLLPLVAIVLFDKATNRFPLAEYCLNAAVLVGIVSLYFFFTGNYYGLASEAAKTGYAIVGTSFFRLMGPFGSPIVAGSYFAIMIAIDLIGGKTTHSFRIARLVLLSICLILTFSRAALFAVLLFAVLWIGITKAGSEARKARMIFAIVLSLLIVVLALLVNAGAYFWNFDSDFYANPRLAKWATGISMIINQPFLGYPFGEEFSGGTWITTPSDNSYLLLLGGVGIPAGMLYCFLMVKGFFQCAEAVKKRVVPAIGMLALLMFFYDFVAMFPANILFLVLLRECSTIAYDATFRVESHVEEARA